MFREILAVTSFVAFAGGCSGILGGGSDSPSVTFASEAISGTVSPEASWKTHAITVDQNGTVELELNWDDEAADLNLFLYDPAGVLVAHANTTTAKPEKVSFDGVQPGVWTVGIKGKSGSAAYTLEVDIIPDIAHEFTGSLSKASSWVTHSFDIASPTTISAVLDWDDTRADLNLFLYDPAGTLVAHANTTAKPETVTHDADTPGAWTLGIKLKKRTAAYVLTVGLDQAGADEPPPAICGNGVLEPGEDCDGGLCCGESCELQPAGTLCRTAVGACDLEEACSGTSADCPADAVAPDGSSCPEGSCSAGVCQAGLTFSGSIADGGWLTIDFEVSESSAIDVTLDWNTSSSDLNLFLYDPAGELVVFANGTSNKPEVVAANATVTGTWRVGIKAKTGGADYDLTINIEPDGPPPPPPPSTSMLIGGAGWAVSDVLDWEQQMGKKLQIVRAFNSGCPATLAASGFFANFLDGSRALHASVKCGVNPDLAALRVLVESTPDNVELYFTAEHEPENPSKNIDAAAWGVMQHDLKSIIDDVNNDRIARGALPIVHVVVLMGWTIDLNNANRDNEGMPYLNAIADLAGTGTELDVDPYDWSVPNGKDPREFSLFVSTIYPVLVAYGFPWGIAETGTQSRTDADTARWLKDAIAWAKSVGARRFQYFNINMALHVGTVNNWSLGPAAIAEFATHLPN